MALISEDEKQDYRSTLADAGYDIDDFTLNELDTTTQQAGIYPLSGKVVVHRKSNAVTREYPAGHATSWPAVFEADLKAGFFGSA